MVRYDTLVKTIAEYLRCHPTIAEMKNQLSGSTHKELFQELQSQNLLNPLEKENYEYTMTVLERAIEIMESNPRMGHPKLIEAYENTLFQYERRLIEGLKTNPVPEVDRDSYRKDSQFESFDDLKDKTKLGDIEKGQINEQEKSVNTSTIPSENISAVGDYYSGDMSKINHEIKHGKYLQKLAYEDRNRIKQIDNTIKKSPGLQQDTTLYMGAEMIDIHLKPGDHGRFKGYTSTSFQEKTADTFIARHTSQNRFKYIIRAPKGTKGLCANADTFKGVSYHDEHEYLLGRNVGYTVLDVDYENNTIEIQLD